jgi:hypothetical protein
MLELAGPTLHKHVELSSEEQIRLYFIEVSKPSLLVSPLPLLLSCRSADPVRGPPLCLLNSQPSLISSQSRLRPSLGPLRLKSLTICCHGFTAERIATTLGDSAWDRPDERVPAPLSVDSFEIRCDHTLRITQKLHTHIKKRISAVQRTMSICPPRGTRLPPDTIDIYQVCKDALGRPYASMAVYARVPLKMPINLPLMLVASGGPSPTLIFDLSRIRRFSAPWTVINIAHSVIQTSLAMRRTPIFKFRVATGRQETAVRNVIGNIHSEDVRKCCLVERV